MSKYFNIVIALAGTCQNASMVTELANKGTVSHPIYETAVKSLFNTDPVSAIDVFGDLNSVRTGLVFLAQILSLDRNKEQMKMMRYVLGSLNIANKLRKNNQVLSELSARLARIKNIHPALNNTILITYIDALSYSFAGTYVDIISPLTMKIKVTGKRECLQNTLTQAKVRTALFACVRAGTLWYQMGGSRSQFIFSRKQLLQATHDLLNSS